MRNLHLTLIVTLFTLTSSLAHAADKPQWIWLSKKEVAGQRAYFRTTFNVDAKPSAAQLRVTCDNHAVVYVNGVKVTTVPDWMHPRQVDVKRHLKVGRNVIAVEARNQGGIAALVARLDFMKGKRRVTRSIVTNKSWKMSPTPTKGWKSVNFNATTWKPAVHIHPYGAGPWGNALSKRAAGGGSSPGAATDTKTLGVAKDFSVELIYTVPKGQQGSWVALTVLPNGDLVASDQGGKGLYRITPPAIGKTSIAKVTRIPVDISNVHGMVYAFGALYVNRNGRGSGLWKITDSNNDGEFDKAEHLIPLRGGGEHGPHAVIVTEDGKDLYFLGGNHTDVPPGITGSRIPTNWGEDLLLPRQWDARGHARGKLAPGGWIARVSPDGKKRELVSIGYRNQYDIALNQVGDLFAYDADMEWDMGSPWYRPTRVSHAVSGSEFGWRSGTGKWPTYYPDSLPPTLNIGPGSPTGAVFGTGAKFPAKYQHALYILDWTFGTIHAVHLEPKGASYIAKKEEFVYGKPLPVTDAIVGKDGSLYFTIGGRGTQSALYRVVYTGTKSTEPAKYTLPPDAARARNLRLKLETFHGKKNAKAVSTAWPYLSYSDRFIRYAARIAIESQPVKSWQNKVLAERVPQALLTGAIALARQGKADVQPKLLAALGELNLNNLSKDQQLELLRAYSLSFIRMGKPDSATAAKIAKSLDAHFPSKDYRVNREMAKVLVYLDSPSVITKTLKLMAAAKNDPLPDWAGLIARNSRYGGTIRRMLDNPPPSTKIDYALALRNMRFGWTLDQRKEYFKFFPYAAKFPGGASYSGFLNNIRKEALANASQAERVALKSITGEKISAAPAFAKRPAPKGPGRVWKTAELAALLSKPLKDRSFDNGRKMYHAALCASCHRFDGEGGAVGPDLSSVASRFSNRDLIEAIIEPSRVISDQFGSSVIKLKNGSEVVGRIITDDGKTLSVSVNPLAPDALQKVDRKSVASIKPSKVSLMLPGLIYALNKEEVLDLFAYMLSRGNKNDPMFKK